MSWWSSADTIEWLFVAAVMFGVAIYAALKP